jgi:hypothetical protein
MATEREDINRTVRRDYESVTAAGAGGTFTVTSNPGMSFELIAVLVHASAVPGGANVLNIELDSAHGATYDSVFATQDMNGLVSFAYNPTSPIAFKAGDKIHVYHAASWAATWTVQVVWRSI